MVEQAKQEFGELSRIVRDFDEQITASLEGRKPKSDNIYSLKLLSRSRMMHSYNSPSSQPLRNFFRSVEKKTLMIDHVMSFESWLLALRQELHMAKAESERLLTENLVAA